MHECQTSFYFGLYASFLIRQTLIVYMFIHLFIRKFSAETSLELFFINLKSVIFRCDKNNVDRSSHWEKSFRALTLGFFRRNDVTNIVQVF